MLKIFNQERGSGKTTEVIRLMTENNNLVLVVPYLTMRRLYPRDLYHRIISADELLNNSTRIRGMRLEKVILDEAFIYEKDKLAKLFYYLGQHQIETIAYGTTQE